MKVTPTQEQLDIIQAVKDNHNLKIEARSGSGKSSTLVMIAEDNPVRSLYLTYNRAMREEAKDKFPDWVDVKTTHSLAYGEVGYQYVDKLVRPKGAYKNVLGTGGEIGRGLRLAPFIVNEDKTVTIAALGNAVKNTVANFEYSADTVIEDKHVSLIEVRQYFKIKEFKLPDYKRRVLKAAKNLWEKRKNLKDDTLITHETYMKLWQLSDPDLSDYEIIYGDEFHDANPCLLAVIKRQKNKVIVVGDFAQAIYQWRGSINAMELLEWPKLELTTSFRFGQDVAEVAHGLVLDDSMKPFMYINGYDKKHTEVVSSLPSNITEGVCHIYRTNAALLEKALELIEQGKKVAIHVDVKDFISKVQSVVALRFGDTKKVKHQDIIIYNSWDELVEEANFTKGELARIVKMVSAGAHNRVLSLLENYKPVKNPDVMLITAHKSKGLEFSIVVIGEDFDTICENAQTKALEFVSVAERNLLYVACTRAQDLLVISETVIKVLDINNFWSDTEPEHIEENLGLEVCDVSITSFNSMGTRDLDSLVRIGMAEFVYDAGSEINQLAEFAIGLAEDADIEDDHWSNLHPHG